MLMTFRKRSPGVVLAACLASCLVAPPVEAETQLIELWRTELPGTDSKAFLATTSTMDLQGRVIVGGYGVSAGGTTGPLVVSRFNEGGELDWQYRTGEGGPMGADALAVDADGRVYVAARLSSEEPRPVALIQLQPDGSEGWRYVEHDAAAVGQVTGSSVALDASGNPIFLFARQPGASWPEPGEYAVAKFLPDGTRLWKCLLPKATYGFPLGGIWRCLAPTPDGGVVVGGVLAPEEGGYPGILAKVSAVGDLIWFRNQIEDLSHAGAISSVCCNEHGVICAAGDEGYVLLSPSGEVINQGWTPAATELAGCSSDGGFLLTCSRGVYLILLNADGSIRWTAWGGFQPGLLPKRDADGAWLQAGLGEVGFSTELIVNRFEGTGTRSPVGVTSGYRYDTFGDRVTSSLLVAPDGTLRVVANLRPQFWSGVTGLAVAAFAIQGVDEPPEIAQLPESTTWDWTNAVTFNVTPAEPERTNLQWHRQGEPIAGATNATWTVPATELPERRGYYYAELTDDRGTVLTPVVELKIGRIRLEPLPVNVRGDYWLQVTADFGSRFRLETSPDLRHWLPWGAPVQRSGELGPLTDIEPGPSFYRAQVIP